MGRAMTDDTTGGEPTGEGFGDASTTRRTDQGLKKRASKLFQPELAGEIRAAVDAERTFEASKSASGYEGVFTAFQGDRLYRRLGVGRLQGLPRLIWIDEEEFLFDPNPAEPFSYTTSATFSQDAAEGWPSSLNNVTITPERMITDGGTIPRIVSGFGRLDEWGYGPAFVIHDWIFFRRRRPINGEPDWTLEQSAWVMAEIMKTLMEVSYVDPIGRTRQADKAEDTLYVIYRAVISSIAKGLWANDPPPLYPATTAIS